MLRPLSGSEPRTRPTPALQRSQDASFEVQRRELNLRHDREALAAERQQLAQERRQLERDRQNFEEQVEERDQQRDQQIIQRHNAAATASAEALAGDLRHDVNDAAPGYTAGLILQAARKAKGELPEAPLSGMAADIVRVGKLVRGETVADAPALPENLTARAIVLSGRRATGVALSADDEAWLSAYLQKAENARRR